MNPTNAHEKVVAAVTPEPWTTDGARFDAADDAAVDEGRLGGQVQGIRAPSDPLPVWPAGVPFPVVWIEEGERAFLRVHLDIALSGREVRLTAYRAPGEGDYYCHATVNGRKVPSVGAALDVGDQVELEIVEYAATVVQRAEELITRAAWGFFDRNRDTITHIAAGGPTPPEVAGPDGAAPVPVGEAVRPGSVKPSVGLTAPGQVPSGPYLPGPRLPGPALPGPLPPGVT